MTSHVSPEYRKYQFEKKKLNAAKELATSTAPFYFSTLF